jgi:hypothetical protein
VRIVSWRQWRCENVWFPAASKVRAGRSQAESKLLSRFRGQWRRLVSQRPCARATSVLLRRRSSAGTPCFAARQISQLILLANVPLQSPIHLVHIDRNLCSDVLWVVELVRHDISRALHAFHLFRAPGIHAQALDLTDMRAQLPVQRSAAHTQEDSKVPACPSWVLCAAVCAAIVAGNIVDEVL